MTEKQRDEIICALESINNNKPTLEQGEGYNEECELRNTLLIEEIMPIVEKMGINWYSVHGEICALFCLFVFIEYPE